MAIAYQSQASVSPTSSTATISKPSGTSAGDLLVALIAGGSAITAPSGWTLVVQRTEINQTGMQTGIWYRVCDGSEGSSFAWTVSGTKVGGVILRYTGTAQSSVSDPTNGGSDQNNSGTPTAPTITTGTANDVLLTIHGAVAFSGTWTTPSGMTLRQKEEGFGTSNTPNWIVSELALGGAGATGAKAAAYSAGGIGWSACVVAIKPLPNTAPSTPTMNSGTTVYHASTHGGSASITVSATTTDPEGNSWFATFNNSIGNGSTVASGGSSTATVSKGVGVYTVTATATDSPGGLTSSASASQTITVYDIPSAPTINTTLDGQSFDTAPITLSATADIADDSWYSFWEIQSNGGAWTSLGNGSNAAGGAASTKTLDPTTLVPGQHKVRVTGKCATHDVAGSTTTETGTFQVNHFGGLLASD